MTETQRERHNPARASHSQSGEQLPHRRPSMGERNEEQLAEVMPATPLSSWCFGPSGKSLSRDGGYSGIPHYCDADAQDFAYILHACKTYPIVCEQLRIERAWYRRVFRLYSEVFDDRNRLQCKLDEARAELSQLKESMSGCIVLENGALRAKLGRVQALCAESHQQDAVLLGTYALPRFLQRLADAISNDQYGNQEREGQERA